MRFWLAIAGLLLQFCINDSLYADPPETSYGMIIAGKFKVYERPTDPHLAGIYDARQAWVYSINRRGYSHVIFRWGRAGGGMYQAIQQGLRQYPELLPIIVDADEAGLNALVQRLEEPYVTISPDGTRLFPMAGNEKEFRRIAGVKNAYKMFQASDYLITEDIVVWRHSPYPIGVPIDNGVYQSRYFSATTANPAYKPAWRVESPTIEITLPAGSRVALSPDYRSQTQNKLGFRDFGMSKSHEIVVPPTTDYLEVGPGRFRAVSGPIPGTASRWRSGRITPGTAGGLVGIGLAAVALVPLLGDQVLDQSTLVNYENFNNSTSILSLLDPSAILIQGFLDATVPDSPPMFASLSGESKTFEDTIGDHFIDAGIINPNVIDTKHPGWCEDSCGAQCPNPTRRWWIQRWWDSCFY